MLRNIVNKLCVSQMCCIYKVVSVRIWTRTCIIILTCIYRSRLLGIVYVSNCLLWAEMQHVNAMHICIHIATSFASVLNYCNPFIIFLFVSQRSRIQVRFSHRFTSTWKLKNIRNRQGENSNSKHTDDNNSLRGAIAAQRQHLVFAACVFKRL